MRFDDKIALITGGASGIGWATALLMASKDCDVTIADNSRDSITKCMKSANEKGLTINALQMDVTDFQQVQEGINSLIAEKGKIDILINSAGILRRGSFIQTTPEIWEEVLRVNLTGSFYCCKVAAAIMKERGFGRIVNVASAAGRSHSTFGNVAYTASKAGVLGLTRQLARELAPHGVTVNAICPGNVLSPMTEKHLTPDISATKPMRRPSTPQEQAYVIAFLASDKNSFMTGASIDVNGGSLML
jgi:3-oxoacyl-[acyl-carrier protein] reductase